ncbi:unnamed protein product [Clonostachys solani]|uniref:Major facilitator superfamily (MFS) profile domain-containing protein n=1 Tax=Clonostachys solani TaxID=160281 RepID=A0A9N9ZIA5_9HYPO|nr:unnamed protein product [Clonostachys solani]
MDSPGSISYPGNVQLGFTMLALFMAMFTANLDATILATAIPKITAEFKSLGDIGWYGSSGFLTYAAFQTSWGKAFKYFHIKWTYLASLFIFELGSLICALAPNSVTLIVGRSVAGIGGAGLCTGTFVIIGYSVRPERRPAFMGVMGATYSLASFIGPIVGGAFAQSVTWRWCFWINLPIGGLTAVLIVFCFRVPSHAVPVDATMKEKLLQLDPSGCALILCAVVCYLLALQWGGLEKSWSNSTVIGTLVGFVLLSGLCAVNEVYMGERASIVPRLLKKRRIFLNQAVVFLNSGGLFVLIYYIPLYFQSIKNDGPLQSGVHNLPFLVGGVFSMISGVVLSATNRWVPFLVASAALSAVGSGLIYTFAPDTPMDKWVGYQILAGSATGFLSQIPIMSNTSAVDMTDMSTISAMTLFFQLIGGSFSVSAAQSVFGNVLLRRIKETAPGVSSSVILGVGASELRTVFTPDQLPGVLEAYMDGLKGAFALATALLAVSALIALMHKWEKLRPEALAMESMTSDEEKQPSEGFDSVHAPKAAKESAI